MVYLRFATNVCCHPCLYKKYLSHPTRTGELGDIPYLSSHPACVARANKDEIDQYKGKKKQ